MTGKTSSGDRFEYIEGRDKVMIRARGRVVKTLKGTEAMRFLAKVERASDEEAQLVMARVTGQFKFGNEKK